MKPVVKKIIDTVVPLAISAGLIIWLIHKVDLTRIQTALRDDCQWGWFFLMVGVLVLSHIIRGIRWGIQLRGAGIPRIPVTTESVSIFGAYALNMVFTYLGEAWRCLYISRLTRSKLSTVVGTDLGDRASDAVVVVLLVVVAMFAAHPAMEQFLTHYNFGRDLVGALTRPSFWIWFGALLLLSLLLCFIFRNTRFIKAMLSEIRQLWNGFAVLFHMKGIGMYIFLTIGIWTCYFAETYICFQAFPFTRGLVHQPGMAWGLVPGLVVFVFGSCSIAIPSSGGLGPWNIAVMFALSLYGVHQADGAAYSLVVWGFQAAALILLGIFSAIYVFLQKSRGFGMPESPSPGPQLTSRG